MFRQVLVADLSMIGDGTVKAARNDEEAIFFDERRSLARYRSCRVAESPLTGRLRHILGDTGQQLKPFTQRKPADVLLVEGVDIGAKVPCTVDHTRSIGPHVRRVHG